MTNDETTRLLKYIHDFVASGQRTVAAIRKTPAGPTAHDALLAGAIDSHQVTTLDHYAIRVGVDFSAVRLWTKLIQSAADVGPGVTRNDTVRVVDAWAAAEAQVDHLRMATVAANMADSTTETWAQGITTPADRNAPSTAVSSDAVPAWRNALERFREVYATHGHGAPLFLYFNPINSNLTEAQHSARWDKWARPWMEHYGPGASLVTTSGLIRRNNADWHLSIYTPRGIALDNNGARRLVGPPGWEDFARAARYAGTLLTPGHRSAIGLGMSEEFCDEGNWIAFVSWLLQGTDFTVAVYDTDAVRHPTKASMEAIERVLAVPAAAIVNRPNANTPTHSDDFTSVIWFGQRFTFVKGNQTQVIRVLWEQWEKGGHSLTQETIGEKAGSSASRFEMAKVFRSRNPNGQGYTNHPAWGTLIQADSKGSYRLCPPKSE